ncbi:MAG: YkgJ family cysteine cluster protein [Proteobacteria bacterium]|nr:YkgJ family cysteine cluster protein [Pseudomonadota bacterium]
MDELLDAGEFGAWLSATTAMLRGEQGAQVPCGSCVGCCVSSYFIPLRPGDEEAKRRIPAQVLVQAAGQPAGHLMMGYRDDGHCPMFSSGGCSIYAHRPQTCRDYDCRIFAAAGIDAGGPEKRVINERVRAWRFSYRNADMRQVHEAVRAAAAFIRDRRESFPAGRAPSSPTGIAVLAIKTHGIFLDPMSVSLTDEARARAVVQANHDFDAGGEGPRESNRR